ncbi:MAG TPA: hypothetical protein ENJ00_09705 [Phycisphaerales bacterium]|nr:hypothetical protein [Phycisphaerales bacterium]
MATTVPTTILGRIQFFQQRLTVWAADPAAIGLAPAQIADLQTKLTLASNKYNEAQTARTTKRRPPGRIRATSPQTRTRPSPISWIRAPR